jgi:hypothetical protein
MRNDLPFFFCPCIRGTVRFNIITNTSDLFGAKYNDVVIPNTFTRSITAP